MKVLVLFFLLFSLNVSSEVKKNPKYPDAFSKSIKKDVEIYAENIGVNFLTESFKAVLDIDIRVKGKIVSKHTLIFKGKKTPFEIWEVFENELKKNNIKHKFEGRVLIIWQE